MDKSADRGAFCVQQETTDTEEMKPSPTRKMEHPHTAWVLLQTFLLTLQEKWHLLLDRTMSTHSTFNSTYVHTFYLKFHYFYFLSCLFPKKKHYLRSRNPIPLCRLIIVPDIKLAATYKNIVAPLFEKIRDNNKEITALTTYRDALLPVLMNGQVEVE